MPSWKFPAPFPSLEISPDLGSAEEATTIQEFHLTRLRHFSGAELTDFADEKFSGND